MRLSEKSITSLIVVMILATLAMLIKDKNYFHKPLPVSYCKIDTIKVSEELKFPYVHCKDSIAEFKINAKLQLYYLHKIIGNDKDSIFSDVNDKNNSIKFCFNILNNDKACLSIRFTKIRTHYDGKRYRFGEYDTVITYRNFNPLTGDGFIFSDFIDTNRKYEFANIIASLVISRYFKPTNDIYRDSSEIFNIRNYYNSLSLECYNYSFYLQDNELYLKVRTKNFPFPILGAEMSYLNNYNFINLSISAFNNCFNTFGSSFMNKKDDLKYYRTDSREFILLSTIGDKPYLIIGIKNDLFKSKPLSIEFLYVYEYEKKEILTYSNHSFENNKSKMEEQVEMFSDERFIPQRRFLEFEQHGDTLIGTWISADEKKKLPFWAKRL